MKKTLLFLAILNSFLFAEMKTIEVTKDFVKKDIKIIDIRWKEEWKRTGIVENSYTLALFDKDGKYDIPLFLKHLNEIIDKDKEFALICNTGSRTKMLGEYLGNKLGYKVINLDGGIQKLMKEGYKPAEYIK